MQNVILVLFLLDGCFCQLDKTVKLWKMSERTRRPEGYNLRDTNGYVREPSSVKLLKVPTLVPTDLVVEASPRRVYANAHTYHINSVSVNSDQETFMSADDLRINLWHLDITNQSFSKSRDFQTDFIVRASDCFRELFNLFLIFILFNVCDKVCTKNNSNSVYFLSIRNKIRVLVPSYKICYKRLNSVLVISACRHADS